VIRISNSGKICVRILAARCARGLRQFHPLGEQRAQGKPGADCTRGRAHKKRTSGPQVQPDHSGFPRTMVYGLLRALPGDRAFLPPSLRGLMIYLEPGWAGHISTKLDASVGASGPHDFTVRARLAKGLAGPRTIRPVSSKTVSSAVRPHAGRSLTEDPPCNPLRARRCRVHRIPPRVRDDSRSAPCRVRRANL
jgi:hypothetical protein